jgi:hypothetical protein
MFCPAAASAKRRGKIGGETDVYGSYGVLAATIPEPRECGSAVGRTPALEASEEDEMDEHLVQMEDLELAQHEAAQVKGGVPPALPDVSLPPSTPPGVPIPYPNALPPKKK